MLNTSGHIDGCWEDPFYFRDQCSLPTDGVLVVSTVPEVHFNAILEQLGFGGRVSSLSTQDFVLALNTGSYISLVNVHIGCFRHFWKGGTFGYIF